MGNSTSSAGNEKVPQVAAKDEMQKDDTRGGRACLNLNFSNEGDGKHHCYCYSKVTSMVMTGTSGVGVKCKTVTLWCE